MVGVFGHEHLCDGGVRWQSALDQTRWYRRLKDDVLAGAAGVFGPTNDQNAELRRHDVEALGDVLTDPVERARTAWAGPALHVDDALDPRQMGRQSTPVGFGAWQLVQPAHPAPHPRPRRARTPRPAQPP